MQTPITDAAGQPAKRTTRLAFALAGEVVRTPQHAMRILVAAQANGRDWLVPQARNVHALLSRATGAAA